MTNQRLDRLHWQSLVASFAGSPGTVLFDMPDGNGNPARYQLLSAWPAREWRATSSSKVADQIAAINHQLSQQPSPTGPFLPLQVGFLAYGNGDQELGRDPDQQPASTTPALVVQEHDWVLVNDRLKGEIFLHWQPGCPPERQQAFQARIAAQTSVAALDFRLIKPFEAETNRSTYLMTLSQVNDYIHAGDVYQVNYAQRFQASYLGEPLLAFQALYQASPSPCSAYMDLGSHQILSLSPERFIRVQGQQVETRPIKGTRRRGRDSQEDQSLIDALLNSPKDRAENLMIVDLLRNDLGRCCEIGSISARPLFAIESYTNVHHLVSTVRGQLRPEFTPLDMLLSAFPGGSITGAPKRRAMEIIRELEPAPRGAYCGSFFHWTPENGLDSTIAIRTLECHEGVITCWGGGGIVADSVPEEEYQESLTKIRLFMEVLEGL